MDTDTWPAETGVSLTGASPRGDRWSKVFMPVVFIVSVGGVFPRGVVWSENTDRRVGSLWVGRLRVCV